jgi:hypothetical protein
LSYVVILIFLGGTYALYIFWGVMIQDFPPRFILIFNPFSALASVLSSGTSTASISVVFGILSGWGPFMGDPGQLADLRPLWHYTLAFQIGLTTGLYLVATRFIKPIRPWRLQRQEVTILALIIFLYLGGGTTIFFRDIQTTINPPPETPTPTPALRPVMPVPMVEPTPVPESVIEEATAEATQEPEADSNEQ